VSFGYAQSDKPDVLTNIQNILPPTPEAFAFSKYGNIPVGLFTGSPNLNIPLTDYILDNIKIPIYLNYSSNGIHVDQMNGSVGLGWSFISAGVISRTIRDKPDDYSNMNGQDAVPDITNIGINHPDTISYLSKCEDDTFDSEPDLFVANFMGNNFKFVFNNNDVPVLLDKSNFKISGSVSSNQFIITGIDGTQYTFSAIEKVKNSTTPGAHGNIYINTQAWYLTSVKNNDNIVYIDYDSSDFTFTLSKLQSMTYTLPGQLQYKYGPYEDHPEACAGCGSCPVNYYSLNANVNDQIYTNYQNTFGSKRIYKIYDNRNSQIIIFDYDIQLNDVFRLKNVKKYNSVNSLIDNVNLSYTLTSNNRLFLSDVTNSVKNTSYNFDYYYKESLPERFTFSRDLWGYYNAKNNTTYIPAINNAMITYNGADQSINSNVGYYGLLKTIKYPTGGSTTLVYENHSSSAQNLIGGYRIKSTTDISEIGVPITKNYSYLDMVQTREPYFFENRKIASTCEGSRTQSTLFANYKAITSNNIHQLMSLNPNVFYGKVIEEISGKGKITHIFETNTDYWGNNILGDPIITSQWTNFGWNNGKEKSTVYEDNLGNKIKSIDYNYIEDTSKKTEVRAIARRKLFNPVVTYNATWNNFENLDIVLYKNISWFGYLKSQTSTDYLNGKELKTTTIYFYDNPNHYQLTKAETSFPDGNFDSKIFNYAYEKNNQKLIDANMVGIPLETIILKNGKALSKTETIYPTSLPTSQTGSLLLPLSVQSIRVNTINLISAPTGEVKDNEVTFDKYDSKGNILQYSVKTEVPTTIIWGYNQTQPIAKIEGATYAQVEPYIADIISKSNSDADYVSEQTLITALDTFRNNSNLSGYQITTYSYDPLIGVTSITPPSGIREIYHYDSANRLDKVTDVNGNILKEYTYHYKQ
jgi:hypothetical protein